MHLHDRLALLHAQNPIYEQLEQDNERYINYCRSKNKLYIPIDKLLYEAQRHTHKITCFRLAQSPTEYLDIYNNWDLYDVYQLYTIKLADNYEYNDLDV